MSPDTRTSLVDAVNTHAAKAGAAAKTIKGIALDDPLADAKIQAELAGLRSGASNLCEMGCAAQTLDDAPSGPTSVTLTTGGSPVRMSGW